MATEKLLLACDLDRTVLPNGKEELTPGALDAFQKFIDDERVILAYLSGRNLELIKDAMDEFGIPVPDIAVGDVGTSMYFRNDGFLLHEGWSSEIASDWQGKSCASLRDVVGEMPELKLQEDEYQNRHKLSFYVRVDVDVQALKQTLSERLKKHDMRAAIVFSIDEIRGVGFLDILPASATKKHALEYLAQYFELPKEQVVYAGDSGNDIEPLTSGYPAVVVKNAMESVKDEVRTIAEETGVLDMIYFAEGGYEGMNGNYAAGILEGLNHFGHIA